MRRFYEWVLDQISPAFEAGLDVVEVELASGRKRLFVVTFCALASFVGLFLLLARG